jgi:cyclopropane fatty-acyl-phospholipid synthase-like methyltransferase
MFMWKNIPESFESWRSAGTYARTSKRLDICAAQFAMLFHLSKKGDLTNKVCLEVGSGWVLSHAIVCYLLGAKHIFATDISPNAHPATLKTAIHGAIPSVVRDTLAPFCDHEKIRERLDGLLAFDKFSFETLEDIGIEYIAPIDLARDNFDDKIDFIYSHSVLEHIPTEDIRSVLEKMVLILNPSGYMIHTIHLEDHKNIEEKPFDFYSEPDEKYSRIVQSQRGNRIRKSQWLNNFQLIDELELKILYEFTRNKADIPPVISPSLQYVDENDLRVTHMGVLLLKKPGR